jgi:hypothetical protein
LSPLPLPYPTGLWFESRKGKEKSQTTFESCAIKRQGREAVIVKKIWRYREAYRGRIWVEFGVVKRCTFVAMEVGVVIFA